MPGTTKRPLTTAVTLVPASSLLPAATELWTREHMLDDLDSAHLVAMARRVVAAADAAGLRTVGAVLDGLAEVLATVTGVEGLTRFLDRDTAVELHEYRAVAGALLAVPCLASSNDSVLTVFAALPDVAPSSADSGRPLRDAEVLAARTVALEAVTAGGRRLGPASGYALMEAGMTSGEACFPTPDDFDDPRDPRTVANRMTGDGDRRLALTPFAANILAQVNDQLLAAGPGACYQSLAYTGRQAASSNSARASVNGNVRRLLSDAALGEASVTAESVRAWGLGKILDRDGLVAAMNAAGNPRVETFYAKIGRQRPVVRATVSQRGGRVLDAA